MRVRWGRWRCLFRSGWQCRVRSLAFGSSSVRAAREGRLDVWCRTLPPKVTGALATGAGGLVVTAVRRGGACSNFYASVPPAPILFSKITCRSFIEHRESNIVRLQ
ncbi:unnamed protein product, partial [Hapterophycus canaliculatus]